MKNAIVKQKYSSQYVVMPFTQLNSFLLLEFCAIHDIGIKEMRRRKTDEVGTPDTLSVLFNDHSDAFYAAHCAEYINENQH